MAPVLIVLIVFSFVAFIVKMGLDHEREKRSLDVSSTQNSLTTSELRRMIRDAVDDANQDLKKRLDTVERRLERSPEVPQIPERLADQAKEQDEDLADSN